MLQKINFRNFLRVNQGFQNFFVACVFSKQPVLK